MNRKLKIYSTLRDISFDILDSMILSYTYQFDSAYIIIKNNISNGVVLNDFYKKIQSIKDTMTELEYYISESVIVDDFLDSENKRSRVSYSIQNDEEVLEIFYITK